MTYFLTARPIWPSGRATEMNRHVGFRAVVPPAGDLPVALHVTASSVYRVHVNGAFVGHGPARGPHGWFRVDKWDLSEHLSADANLIAIEAVGYNVNSYYLLDQPAFLLAEVRAGDDVLASTAGAGVRFEAALLDDHVQRVERYSVARTYSEAFRLRPDSYGWRSEPAAPFEAVPYDVGEVPPLLPRRVPYPDFRLVAPERLVASGRIERGEMPEEPYRDWTLTGLGPDLKGYPEEEFEVAPSLEWQAYGTASRQPVDAPLALPLDVPAQAFHLLDFGVNQTSFIGLRLRCTEPTRLFVLFDEMLTDGVVDPRRLRCLNILDCYIEPGTVEFETLEPYTLRYLQLAVLDGACTVEHGTLRTYANPEAAGASFACSDERLVRLFEAGRETLRQNALDLLMDCPSRERAGWPCDSFFTARAAFLLTGSTNVEQAFLENYALAPQLASLPEGMLPMNYPADHPNGDFLGVRDAQYIPNWPLWLVLQLEEYLARSGDRDLIDAFAPKVRNLFAWFEGYANEDGLLEDLPGWVFIEWSKANEFVAGVNFPSNMLYAAALDAASRLYAVGGWRHRAQRLRQTIAGQAFDGSFFVDQALREDAALRRTEHRTEICQYYAFYFGIATPETYGALWEVLCKDFGPRRDSETAYREVHPAAMLNGYFLRLELLRDYGHGPQALDELVEYFLPMAEATGTLWEHAEPSASCCHGFASHVVVSLCRHVFGLEWVDPVHRVVRLASPARGYAGRLALPLASGSMRLAVSADQPQSVRLPAGYDAVLSRAKRSASP
jgi:alpha-L-rhamnosidase